MSTQSNRMISTTSKAQKQSRKRKPFLPLRGALAAILSAAILLPTTGYAETREIDINGLRLYEVFDVLNTYHVGGLDGRTLSDAGIKSMIQQLNDPYTTYMSPEEWKQFKNDLDQVYVGIGIQLEDTKDGVRVVKTFPGTPAEAAGLKAGDLVVSVNGQSVAGVKASELTMKFPKEENAKVTVAVSRNGQQVDFSLTVQKVTIPAVSSLMLDKRVGYVRVDSFSTDSDELFAAKLAEMKNQGAEALIVDLRNNPGGLLESALNMAKLFIKDGFLIHTKARDGSDDPVQIIGGVEQSIPVTVLVNGSSASSAEVLTGALQDYGKATVLGTKTYGKGSVQSTFELSGGGALKVTMEEYLTPKNRPVNHVGLTPDVTVDGGAAQLVAALRLAGSKNLKLEQTGDAMLVNGIEVQDVIPLVRQDGKTYVHTRVLAALVGASVEWNQELQAVELMAAGGTLRAQVGTDLLNIGGTSLLDITVFAKQFPQFAWSDNGDTIMLQGK